VDYAKNEMKRRFTENDNVLNAVAALDPNSRGKILINMMRLKSQAEVARNTFLTDDRPTTCMQLFAELSKMQRALPDLLARLKVILTIPVASASAERSFSAMRRTKSHLRASVSATRTSDIST